jgi:integrase
MIYQSKPRNWLILELIARGEMRIGEVHQLTPNVEDRKLTLRSPESGKEREIVFIPQKIANRLREYITAKRIEVNHGVFQYSMQPAVGL